VVQRPVFRPCAYPKRISLRSVWQGRAGRNDWPVTGRKRHGNESKIPRKWLNKSRDLCYADDAIPASKAMTLTIDLPQATVHALEARAAATGKDINTIVTEAVQADIVLSKMTLKEVLRPIQEAIASSGMSPAEVDTFFAKQLADVRAERRASLRKV
jgi:hypothetical protein